MKLVSFCKVVMRHALPITVASTLYSIMSEGIRKAWLLEYLITFAEQHGGQLSSLRPKKGKVQIINASRIYSPSYFHTDCSPQFRTLPESPEEWVWADVSDKLHFVTVRFTMEAVKFFNSDPFVPQLSGILS